MGLHIAKVWCTLAMIPTEAFFAHAPNLSNVSVKIVARNSMNFENGEPHILLNCIRRSNSNPYPRSGQLLQLRGATGPQA